MTRTPRIIIPNVPYHVTQRGNHQIDVFYNSEDRKRYFNNLMLYSTKYDLSILAYCLMSNHIHLVAVSRETDSLPKTIKVVSVLHTQRINRIKNWSGNLWQQRYFACGLDKLHLWFAIRYVEQNPLRAGIVERAEDYPWSSAAYHCGIRDDSLITKDTRYREMFENWQNEVNLILDPEKCEKISRCTYKGIPCGDNRFKARMKNLLSR